MEKKFPREVKTSITEELHQRLQVLCEHKGRKSHLIRKAIEEMVRREEKRKDTNRILPSDFNTLVRRRIVE